MPTFKQFINRFLGEDYISARKTFLGQKDEKGEVPTSAEIDVAFAFHKKHKNAFNPILKNIDTQKTWAQFKAAMTPLMAAADAKQKFKHTREQLVLRDDSEWLIVVPLDHGTSCFHGSDTDWCTTKVDKDYFSQYFYDAKVILVYCIKKNDSKDKWAVAVYIDRLPSSEFFTKTDESIGRQKFELQTGLSFNDIVIDIKKNIDYINQKRITSADKDVFALIKRAEVTGPDPAVEAQIVAQKSSKAAYLYARNVLKGRFAKGENLIATNTDYSSDYARYIMKDRFEKGEDAIAKNAGYSIAYARDVLNGRFEKGEDAIATNARLSFEYARYVLNNGRFEKGENAIAKVSRYSLDYATRILKGRFEKGEDAIAKNAEDSFEYAYYVLKGKFPKGEDIIARDSKYSINYAHDVLKDHNPNTWAKRYLNSK